MASEECPQCGEDDCTCHDDDDTGQCDTCGDAYPQEELVNDQCDECRKDADLEAEHHRLESHPSRFL